MSKRIAVAFRYDDYCNAGPIESERQLFDLFQSQGACLCVAVVPLTAAGAANPEHSPQPLSVEKIALLKEACDAGAVDPALHGYSHENAANDVNAKTEFAGLDAETQMRKLADGKKQVEEYLVTEVSTFVPPWNSYDACTLDALAEAGFATISADLAGPGSAESRLRFVPATCGPHNCISAVVSARRAGGELAMVVVLLHPSDFREDRAAGTIEQLRSLLEWLRDQQDVSICSVTEAGRALEVTHPAVFSAHAEFRRSLVARLVPPRLLRPLVYQSRSATRAAGAACVVFVVAGALLAAAAGSIVIRAAAAFPGHNSGLLGLNLIGFVTVLGWFATRRTWVVMLLAAAFIGGCVGFLVTS